MTTDLPHPSPVRAVGQRLQECYGWSLSGRTRDRLVEACASRAAVVGAADLASYGRWAASDADELLALAAVLPAGGLLFVADAESLRGMSDAFRVHLVEGAIYYERTGPSDGRSGGSAPVVHRSLGRGGPVAGWGTPDWPGASAEGSWRPPPAWKLSPATSGTHLGSTPTAPGGEVTTEAAATDAPEPDALETVARVLGQQPTSEAVAWADTLTAEDRRCPTVLVAEAAARLNGGDVRGGEACCQAALQGDPERAEAWHLLALCRESQQDLPGAVQAGERAVYLDPSFAMAALHLGRAARRVGDLRAARRELGRAAAPLRAEDDTRMALFGGGFGRELLVRLALRERDAVSREVGHG